MDQRLYVAACTGDTEALQELTKEDPLILFTVALANSETPLHIAALLGHNEFAKLAMHQNPKLSREFNQHGYSPIHLASSQGHLQVVIDLLNIDMGLCLLKDRDGWTPLHSAAVKGRMDVFRHLLSCCPGSARELTFTGDTILHLVVRYNKCQVMVSLLSLLVEFNLDVDELVNCVDEDGNNILHLAAARKQHYIMKVLVKETKVNVNAMNSNGHTALDILLMCPSESDNYKAKEETTLVTAQGQRAFDSEPQIPIGNEAQAPAAAVVIDEHNANLNEIASSMSSEDDVETKRRRLDSIKSGIIVLCSLFATFCFEAVLNPPGGLWQDWPSSNVLNTAEATRAKEYTHHFRVRAFSFVPLAGRPPHLNFNASNLLAPNKAMSVTLEPYQFLDFLYANASCFVASLITVIIVMLTTSFDNPVWVLVMYLMMVAVVGSAVTLYQSVLQLVTNGQFSDWAIRLGFAKSYTIMFVFLILYIIAGCFKD